MAEDIGFGRLPGESKILWEYVRHSRTVSLGFFFATGSRFDPPGKAGTAHLVEHLLFKGTRNHSAVSLARLVDRVGGDLNAWTDREEMAFTCTVPAEAWKVAVEALAEMCLFPTFPVDEFEREKEVIRSEILSSLEDPEEVSYDDFLQTLSPGEWSRPVAGSEESLARITWDDAVQWWNKFGVDQLLTVSLSGAVDPSLVRGTLSAYWHDALNRRPEKPSAELFFQPVQGRWKKKAPFQMVQILGGFSFPAPSTPREAALWQIFSMLWGETMSSRLFQNIRERQGLCYSVTSQVVDAEGTWALQFFATCSPENSNSLVGALGMEICRLGSEPPTEVEWEEARQALKGGLVLGSEKAENRVARLWHQWKTFGKVAATEEILALLDTPVNSSERADILGILGSQVPSLMLWGKVPRKILYPAPWNP